MNSQFFQNLMKLLSAPFHLSQHFSDPLLCKIPVFPVDPHIGRTDQKSGPRIQKFIIHFASSGMLRLAAKNCLFYRDSSLLCRLPGENRILICISRLVFSENFSLIHSIFYQYCFQKFPLCTIRSAILFFFCQNAGKFSCNNTIFSRGQNVWSIPSFPQL